MASPRSSFRFRTAFGLAFGLFLATVGCSNSAPSNPVPERPDPPSEAPAPIAAPELPVPSPSAHRRKIVVFGDSLTAGFGLEKTQSYPSQLQRLLDAQGYAYEVVNAGVSGETSAGGVRRIEHVLETPDVAVVVVGLGGNDGLRGLPPKDLEKNLDAIVGTAKKHGAKVLLAGMEAPPYLGEEYTAQFRAVYTNVAKREGVAAMPFLLEGVAGDPDLNQVDGIHPNAKGAEIVATHVLERLAPLLAK